MPGLEIGHFEKKLKVKKLKTQEKTQELVRHLTDDVGVLHVGLHVRSDPAPAPSGAKIKTTSVVVTNAYFC